MHEPMQAAAPHLSLWASLCEGRPPQDREVQSVAAKIWHDVFRRDSAIAWSQVEVGSAPYRKSIAAALVALGAPPANRVG